MAERRALERLLARDLSGKEIARLTLLAHTEELAGKEPTFSEAEIERAKATLRGRPHDIAVYNAWIEASRIVDFVSLEAIANAADAEMRLSIAIGATAQLLRHGTIRAAREMATKVLTPDEWARFPAEREKARRERMAEQRVSLDAVIHYRTWQIASDDLRAKARALPEFEEDENEYDCLLAVDSDATLRLRKLAEQEIIDLVESGKLRFSREGEDVSRLIGSRDEWQPGGRARGGVRDRGRVQPARAGGGRAAGMGGVEPGRDLHPARVQRTNRGSAGGPTRVPGRGRQVRGAGLEIGRGGAPA